MANDINRSFVTAILADVRGKILQDTVEFKFYNVRLASERMQVTVALRGRAAKIKDLPAAPNGLAQVFITPQIYRYKSIFVNVPSDGTGLIHENFFVDPAHAKPKFPSFTDIQSQPRWARLRTLLSNSNVTTAKTWNALDDQKKAGLLNLHSKMNATSIGGASVVTDLVQKVENFLPARILARVDPNLISLVASATQAFHTVPGALHEFDAPWKALEGENSWKTFDSAGNLQLTFAGDGKGNFLADIDIDDHQGVEHAADVLKHVFTGKDTHPYDIHEILIFFQQLDPGYSLV